MGKHAKDDKKKALQEQEEHFKRMQWENDELHKRLNDRQPLASELADAVTTPPDAVITPPIIRNEEQQGATIPIARNVTIDPSTDLPISGLPATPQPTKTADEHHKGADEEERQQMTINEERRGEMRSIRGAQTKSEEEQNASYDSSRLTDEFRKRIVEDLLEAMENKIQSPRL